MRHFLILMAKNLIKRAKTDPHAFAELYEVYFAAIYNYVSFRLKNKTETEDVVSQVWEIILKNIAHLKTNHPIAFKAWIFTIARNTIYKHFLAKKNNSTENWEDKEITLSGHEPNPLEFSKIKDEVEQLKALIETLPSKQKEMLSLRFIGEFKNKEIAKIMNVEEKSVASNISRALQALKKQWKKLQ